MDFDQIKRRAWFSGSLIGVLAVLGVVMAALQYRDRRVEPGRASPPHRLSYDFDAELNAAITTLQPSPREVAPAGSEAA